MPVFVIWVGFLFIDCWKIIVINDQTITVYLIGIKISTIKWQDINKIKMEKTNQFKNYAQCNMICLYGSKKRITIPEKMYRFDLFFNYLKQRISSTSIWDNQRNLVKND
jgi:hypothetical protein